MIGVVLSNVFGTVYNDDDLELLLLLKGAFLPKAYNNWEYGR